MSTSSSQRINDIVREMQDSQQGGRDLTRIDRLVQLRKLTEAGGIQTMEVLLPLALTLNGKPYHLGDHAPFSPLFRTQLPKNALYMTARQVGKSLSIASRGLMLSVSKPNFRTLFITPLYEQIRRFSNNYMRPFIEQSPIRSLWTGTNTENSVLQRSFKNLSTMLFSFALLDADRLRGISCDSISVDESIRIGTMVETPTGCRPIETLQPGDPVIAFDKEGNLDVDEVVTCSDHGIRDCFRFETADGSAVEATADSWLATTAGWKRVGTVIADAVARTNAVRDDAGRRALSSKIHAFSEVHEPPRLRPTRLQLPKIPGVIRVRTEASQKSEELGLRRMVEFLGDTVVAGVFDYSLLVSPRRQEACDAGMVERDDLGGNRLVVSGRRLVAGPTRDVPHRRIQPAGSGITGGVAVRDRPGRMVASGATQTVPGYVLLHNQIVDGRDLRACRETQALCLPGDAVQNNVAGAQDRSALPMVRSGFCDYTSNVHGAQLSQLLQQRGVPAAKQASNTASVCIQAGDSRKKQRTIQSELLRRFRGQQGEVEAEGRGRAPGEPGRTQSCKATIPAENTRSATSAGLDVQAVRINGSARHTERRQEILRSLPRNCNAGDTPCIRGAQKRAAARGQHGGNDRVPGMRLRSAGESGLGRPPKILLSAMQDEREQRAEEGSLCGEASEIVKITWTGRHRVFDIETKKYSTFIAGGIFTHNCQDFDPAHLPIAREAMSHSDWAITTFTGTPKTLDNPIHGIWKRSSQAEWLMRCRTAGCGAWNIPSREFHVDKMIGPWHDSISEQSPGTICFKCAKPISPRHGHWVHRYPDRRYRMAGYHIPQIILPLHYSRQDKWAELRAKREGWGNTPINVFYNEVLGESVDAGQKLVTETQLRAASSLGWKNDPTNPHPEVMKRLMHYQQRFLCIDWGGGGEDGVSFTVLALLCVRSDGKIECVWGKRLVLSQEHLREAREIQHWFAYFHADMLVHDYSGAGTVRETVLVQAGLPLDRVMPISLIRTAHAGLMRHVAPTILHNRSHYRLDKPRSLLYTCQAIKTGLLRFFEYDSENADNPGLIGDFLALVEEKTPSRLGGDIYTITRNTTLSDDFAQAINLGCAAIWHVSGQWPNFAEAAAIARITQAQLQAAGASSYGWDDDLSMTGSFNQP